jgi:hypothetical protein
MSSTQEFFKAHKLTPFELERKTESSLARLRVIAGADAAVIWGFYGPLDPGVSPKRYTIKSPLVESLGPGILSPMSEFPIVLTKFYTEEFQDKLIADSVYVIFITGNEEYFPISAELGSEILVFAPIAINQSGDVVGYTSLYYMGIENFEKVGEQRVRNYIDIFNHQLSFTLRNYKEK